MRVVLFDLDGTLVKAGGAGRKALDRTIFDFYGVADVCSRFSLAGRTDKDNFRIAFVKALRRKPTEAELKRVELGYLRRLPREVRLAVHEKRYEEIEGISRLLRALAKRKDVLIGLGTGNVEKGARIKLKPSGLSRHFAFGGYGADGYTRTPLLRAAVRRAAALCGRAIERRRVFVIGDTARDVRAGKKAGYRTAAVLDGFGDEADIRRSRPELIARDFSDLQKWIRWILST